MDTPWTCPPLATGGRGGTDRTAPLKGCLLSHPSHAPARDGLTQTLRSDKTGEAGTVRPVYRNHSTSTLKAFA